MEPVIETTKQLTERTYLGAGYVHCFRDSFGTEVFIPCTQQEYESLAQPNPVNPTLKGHTWQYSAGGTIKVDTPDTMLGEDEFCRLPDGTVHATLKDVPDINKYQVLTSTDVTIDGLLDVTKIK